VSTDSIFDNAESAEVSYGLGGIAMAVWRRESDDYIMASRYNGTWSSNKDISGGDGANPEIAFDPDGNVIAVWQNTFGSEIYIRRFLASSTWPNWEGDGPLLFDSAETAGNPQISVDPGGNVFIVWERDGQILAKRYEAGSDWASWVSSGPVTVLDDSGSNPEIAVDANGRAIAVWVSGGNIYSKRYFE
jgi:hypothetical protein